MRRQAVPGCPRWVILCVFPVFLLSTSAFAEPERGKPRAGSESESESIQGPARATVQDDERRQLGPVQLEPLSVPASFPEHRGEILIDAGRNEAPRLNDLELVKLEMARAAVEASLAAGTLHITHVPEDLEPASPEEIEAIKLQQLEGITPLLIESDPVAGIGEIEPIQEIGPPGLTDYEQRKLDGESPEPTQAEEIAAPPVDHVEGDGAPAPVREVQSDE